jgi:hypothetical protein
MIGGSDNAARSAAKNTMRRASSCFFMGPLRTLHANTSRLRFQAQGHGAKLAAPPNFVVDSSQGFDHTRGQIRDILRKLARMRRR